MPEAVSIRVEMLESFHTRRNTGIHLAGLCVPFGASRLHLETLILTVILGFSHLDPGLQHMLLPAVTWLTSWEELIVQMRAAF